jgi:hypothetical protein
LTHSIGSEGRATAVLIYSLTGSPKQWFEAAHLARLIALLSPFLAKHNCQHEVLVPHWSSHDWIAGIHLESLRQAVYSFGQCSLIQSVGS